MPRIDLLKLNPPAKLNLFLHILGRRADGYHRLQTAFELIDWCDELELCVREGGDIVRTGGPKDVPAELDLVVRAARALQRASGTALGAHLHLSKYIPQGAGLGGGSSDAAATLLGLNRLWNLRWPLERLAKLGLELGADVPVFLGQQPAWAEGVGERLLALPFVKREYLVVFPGVALATGPMFAEPALRRDCAPLSLERYQEGSPVTNVFEAVAYARSAEIAAAAQWLAANIGPASMTGSGSALFVRIRDRAPVQARMRAAPITWTWRCVRSIANWFDKP